jgi:hypothetical protein
MSTSEALALDATGRDPLVPMTYRQGKGAERIRR